MSEFNGGDQRLSWQLQPSVYFNDILIVYLERQLDDTILPDAGVPVRPGDYYYGMHMMPLSDSQPVRSTIIGALAATAAGIEWLAQTWDSEAGKSPQQIVGVTHLGLARLARRGGFSCAEIPEKALYRKVNDRRRWGDYATEVNASYKYETESGRKGRPLRFGVISQPVDEFIHTWGRS